MTHFVNKLLVGVFRRSPSQKPFWKSSQWSVTGMLYHFWKNC